MSRGRRRKSKLDPSMPNIAIIASIGMAVFARNHASAALIFLRDHAAPAGLVALALAVTPTWFWVQARRRQYKRWDLQNELKLLTPTQFEAHVAEFYRRNGYKVRLTPVTGDQGVDVLAERDGERIAVQCKLYSANVGNDAVQQVLAGMHFYRCTHGVVIASTGFTRSAMELARRSNVQLITGTEYAELRMMLIKR